MLASSAGCGSPPAKARAEAGTVAERNMARMGIGWVSFEGQRFEYRPLSPGVHCTLIASAMREKVRQNAELRRKDGAGAAR